MTLTESYFAINRRVAAPRALVFQAWTDPELVGRWYRGEPFDYREWSRRADRVHHRRAGPGDRDPLGRGRRHRHHVRGLGAGRTRRTGPRCSMHLAETVAQGSQSGGNAGGIRPG